MRNTFKMALVFVLLIILAMIAIGYATIPIPSSIPILNSIPILGALI